MKKFISFLFALGILISLHSCKVKDGEPGPAGESSMLKQGSISGTLFYKYSNGDTAIVPFNHEYYESMDYNIYSFDTVSNNEFGLEFYRSQLKESSSYLRFSSNGYVDNNNILQTPTNNSVYFQLINKYKNKIYNWTFRASSDKITITDFKIDPKTGVLTYNYVIELSSSDINFDSRVDNVTQMIIKGTVNVTLDETEYSGCINC